ncbi:hypothetical protein PLESTB_001736800 [Pleodorina starrii]|uniref:Peptidase S1 domain-containing protein n=1 Tax=Pleodorina starrii TaxID=330485 RepID=A0A9W6F9F2_9CHLO|nr:hypothetical protein PLESTM_000745000 [Pleodorina starrii]GLC61259.1 hypothetical protein PLESTB_001736800 [Pleodorina starrii]GLC74735.1 hypothetical protein PLESTF_001549800 [Pleodorina starrii]
MTQAQAQAQAQAAAPPSNTAPRSDGADGAEGSCAPGPGVSGGCGHNGAAGGLTRADVPPSQPYNLVGQLRNGCTAFLAGPCHVITVAHCVYDPAQDIWWPGLEFSAGRNGASAWAPYGTATWRATEVPEGWRRSGGAGTAGAELYDYAVVVLAAPLGRQLGWMQPGGCRPTDDTAPVVVQVAGYPDDRENGTLWLDTCRLLPPSGGDSQGGGGGGDGGGGGGSALRYHDCHTRGGNSGSPLWLPPGTAASASASASASPAPPSSSSPCVLGMHVAGERVRRWDAAGRLYDSRTRGVAVDLEGAAGAWLRAAIAQHPDC